MDDGQDIPLSHLLPSTKHRQDHPFPPRQPYPPSRSPSKSALLRAAIAALLALDSVKAAVAQQQQQSTPGSSARGRTGGEIARTPEVPEFLCPALGAPLPVPRTRFPPSSTQDNTQDSDSYSHSKGCVTLQRYHHQHVATFAPATTIKNSHRLSPASEYLYLARSTSSSTASSYSTSSFSSSLKHSSSSLFVAPSPTATAGEGESSSSSARLADPEPHGNRPHDDRPPPPPPVEGQFVLDNHGNANTRRQGTETETSGKQRQRYNGPSANNSSNDRSAPSNFNSNSQSQFQKHSNLRRGRGSSNTSNNNYRKRSTDVDGVDTSTNGWSELYTSRTIPDRYELGNDGRWHKLSVSSSCSVCECGSQSVDESADNDLSATGVVNTDTSYEAEDSNISGTTLPPTTSTASGDSLVVLPDGWDRDFASVVYQVPLIVIASLILAAAVTGAVWFTFFWRGRQRIARKEANLRDLEKRSGNESDGEDDGEDDGSRRGTGRRGRRTAGVDVDVYADGRRRERMSEKAKARWARATAQWKAHVRWIHRRRRGRASIVDGMKQRDYAMASGVSLARTIPSEPSGSQTEFPPGGSGSETVGSRRRRSGSGTRGGRGAEESGGESSSSLSSSDFMSHSTNLRVRDTERGPPSGPSDHSPSPPSRDQGTLSDDRRSVLFLSDDPTTARRRQRRRVRHSLPDDSSDPEQREREADEELVHVCRRCHHTLSRSRSSRSRLGPTTTNGNTLAISSDDPVPTSSSSFIVARIHNHNQEYDRPPPDIPPPLVSGRRVVGLAEDEDARQGPPAYHFRRSDDHVLTERRGSRRRRGRRRLGVNEKRPAASGSGSGYVPAPGDYVPYSSSESDAGEAAGSESDGGTRSSRSSVSSMGRRNRRNRREHIHETSMHIAMDDKQALERMATYASAPPVPSPPPPHPDSSFSPTSSPPPPIRSSSPSLPSGHHAFPAQPNAPPEPEIFEAYEYECASPGAGPGPSTVSARSRSTSPSSRSGSRTRARDPRSPSSPFPAPPPPISSRLAYAPADAGLGLISPPPTHPPDSDHSYAYGYYGYGAQDFGLDLDSALERVMVEGGSAPPFSASPLPYAYEDIGGAPSAPCGEDGDVLGGASAPPLFVEDEDEDEDGRESGSTGLGSRPSAPPLDDDGDVVDVDVRVARNASAPTMDEPRSNRSALDVSHKTVSQSAPKSMIIEDGSLPSSTESPPPPTPPRSPPPDTQHVDGADRDAVLTAVR